MQKKIIALAIAAAFSAPAFADTAVYGVVDAAVASFSADGQKGDVLAVSGGLATSRVGLNSSEDLGNGMKAVVNLEYGLDTQQADGIGAARQEMLAVAGGFGTFATGYLQTTGYDFGKSFDPTAGSAVSPLGNVTKGGGFLIGAVAGAARAPRALAYISPDMGGFTVAVNYTTAFTPATGNLTVPSASAADKSTAYLVSANYKAGALAVGVVYASLKGATTQTTAVPPVVSGGDTTTETAIGASFDLEVAKLFATYQKQSTSGVADHTAMSVSAVAPVGPGAVALSYAKNSGAVNTVSGSDANATGMTAAWLQGLSKTTTFYAAYSRTTQDAGTSSYSVANNLLAGSTATDWVAGGGSSSIIALGLNKKF